MYSLTKVHAILFEFVLETLVPHLNILLRPELLILDAGRKYNIYLRSSFFAFMSQRHCHFPRKIHTQKKKTNKYNGKTQRSSTHPHTNSKR